MSARRVNLKEIKKTNLNSKKNGTSWVELFSLFYHINAKLELFKLIFMFYSIIMNCLYLK